jgi:hypothetical protein
VTINIRNYYGVVKTYPILKMFKVLKFSRRYDVKFCYSVAHCR